MEFWDARALSGLVWIGVPGHEMVRYGLGCQGTHGLVWFGVPEHTMVWYGSGCRGTQWFGMDGA